MFVLYMMEPSFILDSDHHLNILGKVVDRILQGEELGYMNDIFGNTAKGRKGAIGVLTSGRIYRDELEENAVVMALTKIVSKEMYE